MPGGAPARRRGAPSHLERLFRELGPAGVEPPGPVPHVGLHGGQRAQPHASGRCTSVTTRSPASGTPTWPTAWSPGRSPAYAVTTRGGLPRRADDAAGRGHDHGAQLPDPAGRGAAPSRSRGRPRRPSPTPSTRCPPRCMDALRAGDRRRRRSTSDDVLDHDLSVPGSRFAYDPATGLPDGRPAAADGRRALPVRDQPHRPRTSPTRPMLYGHGLLGEPHARSAGGSTARLRERGLVAVRRRLVGHVRSPTCRTSPSRSSDLSGFPSVVDRIQQGFLNFLFLGRALSPPRRAHHLPAFRGRRRRTARAGRRPRLRRQQPGRDHGRRAAPRSPRTSERAVLGVPGMALLDAAQPQRRLGGRVRGRLRGGLPDPIDQQLGYALVQMLWDRGESAGYAQHMTSDPLPGTPTPRGVPPGGVRGPPGGERGAPRSWPARSAPRSSPCAGARACTGRSTRRSGSARCPAIATTPARCSSTGTPPAPACGRRRTATSRRRAGKDPHGAPGRTARPPTRWSDWLLHGHLRDVCAGGPVHDPARPDERRETLSRASPRHPGAPTVILRRAATRARTVDGETGIEVLMLHRTSKGAFGGMWVFPGGRVDDGDRRPDDDGDEPAARRAAAREAVEECGLAVDADEIVAVLPLDAAARRPEAVRHVVLPGPRARQARSSSTAARSSTIGGCRRPPCSSSATSARSSSPHRPG